MSGLKCLIVSKLRKPIQEINGGIGKKNLKTHTKVQTRKYTSPSITPTTTATATALELHRLKAFLHTPHLSMPNLEGKNQYGDKNCKILHDGSQRQLADHMGGGPIGPDHAVLEATLLRYAREGLTLAQRVAAINVDLGYSIGY